MRIGYNPKSRQVNLINFPLSKQYPHHIHLLKMRLDDMTAPQSELKHPDHPPVTLQYKPLPLCFNRLHMGQAEKIKVVFWCWCCMMIDTQPSSQLSRIVYGWDSKLRLILDILGTFFHSGMKWKPVICLLV